MGQHWTQVEHWPSKRSPFPDALFLPPEGGRDQIGMVAAIKSVAWPRSNRNRWPRCIGFRTPGPSSIISKAVIEEFTARFLEVPAVLWLSESGNKVVAQDDKLAARIGLKIEPDLILADLGPDEPLLVFVEVVATDGAITERRQQAVYKLTDAAGLNRAQVAFVTAYQDRQSAGFKKTVPALAWGSFAWFISEPEHIMHMQGSGTATAKLSDLVKS